MSGEGARKWVVRGAPARARGAGSGCPSGLSTSGTDPTPGNRGGPGLLGGFCQARDAALAATRSSTDEGASRCRQKATHCWWVSASKRKASRSSIKWGIILLLRFSQRPCCCLSSWWQLVAQRDDQATKQSEEAISCLQQRHAVMQQQHGKQRGEQWDRLQDRRHFPGFEEMQPFLLAGSRDRVGAGSTDARGDAYIPKVAEG